MSVGLLGLLDDVTALAKVAAASIDDVAGQAAKAGLKAAGAVIDDAAVTPNYVTGFAADPVIVALAQWVYLEAPDVAAYFQRAHLPLAEMNTLLQNLNEPGATIEGVADAFVAARGEVWQAWVGAPPQ